MRRRRLTESCILASWMRPGPIKGSAGLVPPAWLNPKPVDHVVGSSSLTMTFAGLPVDVSSVVITNDVGAPARSYVGDPHEPMIKVGIGSAIALGERTF